jgi:hypothetical protein
LRRDLLHVVESRHQVAEARRREQYVDRRDPAGFVDGDDTVVQTVDGFRVLAAEELELVRL